MSHIKQDKLRHESRIKQVVAKVQKMCKQAKEDQCVQPAMREELEEMLFSYVK